MKNNLLKVAAIIAIVLGLITAIFLIIYSLKPKEELNIEPLKTPKIEEIIELPKITPIIENRTENTSNEIRIKIEEIKKVLEDISEKTPIPITTPQIIIQMQHAPTPIPTPVSTPTQVETIIMTPTPMQQESLKVISPQSGQGITLRPGRHFVAISDDIIDNETERSYMNIGLVVRGNDGNSVKDAVVEITTTNLDQNKTLNGTGNITKIVNDKGVKEVVHYYPFHYEFRITGNHTITFRSNGMVEVVNIEGVVEPANLN